MQNGTTFIQANITLSTLPGFNLLAAIKQIANKLRSSHILWFWTSRNSVYYYRLSLVWSDMQIMDRVEY